MFVSQKNQTPYSPKVLTHDLRAFLPNMLVLEPQLVGFEKNPFIPHNMVKTVFTKNLKPIICHSILY